MKNQTITIVLISLLSVFAFSVNAATIQSAVSVNSGTVFTHPDIKATNLIDQSGLTDHYISGVTDFDSFVSTTKHYYPLIHEWFASQDTYQDTLIFDLGSSFQVNKIAIWNEDFWGTKQVKISASNYADFSLSQDLGTFFLSDNALNQQYMADILSLNTFSRYFKFELENEPGITLSLGEVAFSTMQAVPVPAALYLFLLPFSSFFLIRRYTKLNFHIKAI